MFAREMSPNSGVVNTVSSLALGSTVGADAGAGGYIRVAGTFPYPVMTHSQHSRINIVFVAEAIEQMCRYRVGNRLVQR